MSLDDWPDWLPTDWTLQIKKIDQRKVKCYVDSQGRKCYSKPQVFDHLKKIGRKQANENTDDANGSTLDLSVAPENEVIGSSFGGPLAMATRSSRKKSVVMQEAEGVSAGVSVGDGSPSVPLSSERSHGDSSWLPDGWTVEVKTRKGGNSAGMKYKYYTDPISGQKFFSKPQVLSHLAKTNRSVGGQKELNTEPIIATPISAWRENASTELDNSQTYETTEEEKNKSEKKTESTRMYSDRRVVTSTPAEGLPPGWIKELRLRNDGIKRDPFFVDPLSEYVFFSKKDALRYLEAGDVKSCVMKPMRRDMNAVVSKPIRSITGGVFSTPDASQKAARTRAGGSFSSPKEAVSDWLPDGWTVEVHFKSSGMKYKIYKDSASGKKLYSKPQVLDYIANGNSSNSRKRKKPIQKAARTRAGGSFSSPKEEVFDWLPDGWTVGVHHNSSGMKRKIYMESASGKKLYTKPQVLDYISSNSRKFKFKFV